MSNEQIVGFVVVTEAFDYSVPQEFAGASEIVRVEAGRYPAVFSKPDWNRGQFYIRFEGTLTYRGWFGTNTRVDHPNTHTTASSHRYGYELAMAALGMKELCVGRVDGRPLFASFELAEGVEALSSGTIGHLYRPGDALSLDGCVRPEAVA
jgi:hypothetical protein